MTGPDWRSNRKPRARGVPSWSGSLSSPGLGPAAQLTRCRLWPRPAARWSGASSRSRRQCRRHLRHSRLKNYRTLCSYALHRGLSRSLQQCRFQLAAGQQRFCCQPLSCPSLACLPWARKRLSRHKAAVQACASPAAQLQHGGKHLALAAQLALYAGRLGCL